MEQDFEAIKANLFPASHAAIKDWGKFPWHKHKGRIQTDKPRSSQALAIDVFGTIQVSEERNLILGALAQRCGLPVGGTWCLKLEWCDPDDLLCEPRPTQVDAIALGQRAILVIECKFGEIGGGCSQPSLIKEGANSGLRQCNGDYAMQINPTNALSSHCALTGKGVGYWDIIPEIFGIDAEAEYRPCPFKGEAYQWMRVVVLAHKLSIVRGIPTAVIAAYAEADGLPTAEKARSGRLGHGAASGKNLVVPLSYQSIVAIARSVSKRPSKWDALAAWVEHKIASVTTQTETTPRW